MRQTFHVLIVDRHADQALATWHGSRWLLPVLTCHERVRAGAALVRWACQRGVRGELVGQWVGRVTSNGTDWLAVISATTTPDTPGLAWTPLDRLANASSLIDYQGWAVTNTLERGSQPSVAGPFGRLAWPDEVKSWIGRSVGATPGTLVPYRVTAHAVVLGVETAHGRVYFKGLAPDRTGEARLTPVLAALAPLSFARTLAIDARADGSIWWLTGACPGEGGRGSEHVARHLARLQRRVMASGPVIRELQAIDLADAARWASALAGDRRCGAAIAYALERVVNAPVPESWIPMDLDPTNVLVTGEHVRFIDLDDSFFGPAPLAMAVFARRCRDESLYAIYQRSWVPPLDAVEWPAFELMATVFESWRGWQRVKRNTERGDVSGALEPATRRIRDRLLRASQRA